MKAKGIISFILIFTVIYLSTLVAFGKDSITDTNVDSDGWAEVEDTLIKEIGSNVAAKKINIQYYVNSKGELYLKLLATGNASSIANCSFLWNI